MGKAAHDSSGDEEDGEGDGDLEEEEKGEGDGEDEDGEGEKKNRRGRGKKMATESKAPLSERKETTPLMPTEARETAPAPSIAFLGTTDPVDERAAEMENAKATDGDDRSAVKE